jgi:hypothetical protein
MAKWVVNPSQGAWTCPAQAQCKCQHKTIWRKLYLAVKITPKIQYENTLLVLVYWHQIWQNEQSTHHRAHELAQHRLIQPIIGSKNVPRRAQCKCQQYTFCSKLYLAVKATPKIHYDENTLLVLIYWHQIWRNELSTHHRAHELAQDRLSASVTMRHLTEGQWPPKSSMMKIPFLSWYIGTKYDKMSSQPITGRMNLPRTGLVQSSAGDFVGGVWRNAFL